MAKLLQTGKELQMLLWIHYIPLTTLSRESKIALKFNVQTLDSEKDKRARKILTLNHLLNNKCIAKRRLKYVILESWECFLLVEFCLSLFMFSFCNNVCIIPAKILVQTEMVQKHTTVLYPLASDHLIGNLVRIALLTYLVGIPTYTN